MRTLLFPFVFLLIIFGSCSKKSANNQMPADIIPKAKFIKVMTDCRLAESAITLAMSKGEDRDKVTQYFYKSVWNKHKITVRDFDASIEYYSKNPKVMDEIFQKVVTNLSEMQSKVDYE